MIRQRSVPFFRIMVIASLLLPILACGKSQDPDGTRAPLFPSKPIPTQSPSPAHPTSTAVPLTPTAPAPTSAPTATLPVSGPAVTNVRFALDVDQTGELVFPGTEFLDGVTRVYVRFAYQELGNVTEVQTKWFLNENIVSSSKMAWDGYEEGEYVIWVEDPNGLGRGQWRLELSAGDTVLGGAAFAIGGEAGYVSTNWGVSLDPPPTWEIASEQEGFVTFSSPDQRRALALRAGPPAPTLLEAADQEIVVFRQEYPDADVVASEEVTMNGEAALLRELHYRDQENMEQVLFIVSTLWDDSAYSMWVLGPAEELAELKTLMVSSLLSVRFLDGG